FEFERADVPTRRPARCPGGNREMSRGLFCRSDRYNPKHFNQFRPTGSVILLVLVATGIAATVALTFYERSRGSLSAARFAVEHTQLRRLAESAVEELRLHLQTESNAPGTEIFRSLRAGGAARAAALPVPAQLPYLHEVTHELKTEMG